MMKEINKNNAFKWSLLLLMGLLFCQTTSAQSNTQTRTVEHTFSGKKVVSLDHSYGPIKVHPSSDNTVRLVARMEVEGSGSEDIEKTLRQLKVTIDEFDDRLQLSTRLSIENWNSNNKRIKIKFRDGTKVSKIKTLKVYTDLYIPQLESLQLSNKYDNIYLGNIETALEIELYSGRLEAKDVKGNVELKLKYSKAQLGSIANGDFNLYDSKINLERAQALVVESKYSEGSMGPTQTLRLKTYDDNFRIGDIAGALELEDKYSEFEFGTFQNAVLDVYDSDIQLKTVQQLKINKSKYSEFRIQSIDQLDFTYSYDDKWIIDELGSMEGESKYTEFSIRTCHRGLDVKSYDDNIIIRKVMSTFDHLELSGKYTELEFPIPSTLAYQLEANLTHGKLDFPENRFENQYYKEKSSKLEVRGRTTGASDTSPKVLFDVYDCRINLR
ncbi:MAG: hypothetical protein AAGD05_09170 [Bacteroidota bacterium]